MRKDRRKTTASDRPLGWLPIDSRILPPIFSFGHVRGIARLFLTCEMFLAILIVLGTLLLLVFSLVG